jgi:hypothetical protein
MKSITTNSSILILLFLAVPVILLSGCGSDVAKSQGCPSGSYLANATDTIKGPDDITFVADSFFNAPYPGGFSIPVTPLTFTVTDSVTLEPRNNICLTIYTGDTAAGPGPFWYTDVTYGTVITGTGIYNYRTVVTNDTGVAILYWSTAVLPAAIPKTPTTTPGTFTAGPDQTGISFIQVYSGTHSALFNFNWTVTGEPAS